MNIKEFNMNMNNALKNISAEVMCAWTRRVNKNCKFLPKDKVLVLGNILGSESKKLQSKTGMIGTVIAVTVANGGRMRGASPTGYNNRQFTRYYVQFADGYVGGYHSHYLKLAKG
jgi:hypothetical protein